VIGGALTRRRYKPSQPKSGFQTSSKKIFKMSAWDTFLLFTDLRDLVYNHASEQEP